jgi:hypothetical protein
LTFRDPTQKAQVLHNLEDLESEVFNIGLLLPIWKPLILLIIIISHYFAITLIKKILSTLWAAIENIMIGLKLCRRWDQKPI